ncbi:MAG: DUF1566 domain-containing protein [Planctomycetota bacterium]
MTRWLSLGLGATLLLTLTLIMCPGGCPPSEPASTGGSGTGATSGGTTTGTIALAATGQTTSYASGDDGETQEGQWLTSATRFVDNGDGTITDQLTGLMWLQDASCLATHGAQWENDGWDDGWVPWLPALAFIGQINSGTAAACGAGYTDWRVPNVVELESLVNAGEAEPYNWLIAAGFLNVENNDYWTATTDPAATATFAYVVNFEDGSVSRLGNKATTPGITSVWPVRGTTSGNAELWQTGQIVRYALEDDGDLETGTAWPSPRFTDNGDGTITDNLTGLMWLQDAETIGVSSWLEALQAATRLNAGTAAFVCTNYTASYTDWRVPNRKELFSLANFAEHDPALAGDHPFVGVSVNGSYWTSTTSAADTTRAWQADMRTGELGTALKVNGYRVMLVR